MDYRIMIQVINICLANEYIFMGLMENPSALGKINHGEMLIIISVFPHHIS